MTSLNGGFIKKNAYETTLNFIYFFLQAVDIRQIYDKFPEKKGGLKELYDKGPQLAFFLVKFWVSFLWICS